jgi:hypothetical protein
MLASSQVHEVLAPVQPVPSKLPRSLVPSRSYPPINTKADVHYSCGPDKPNEPVKNLLFYNQFLVPDQGYEIIFCDPKV